MVVGRLTHLLTGGVQQADLRASLYNTAAAPRQRADVTSTPETSDGDPLLAEIGRVDSQAV
jgi:hypothetical protein